MSCGSTSRQTPSSARGQLRLVSPAGFGFQDTHTHIHGTPPPPCTHAFVLESNLSLREAWVRGIPLSPSLSPKSQVQDGVGVWDWGECLQIVTLFFHVWRVPSKIAPNHPNHFRIILIRARPWIQDPRSKIAHRSCAGNLGSNAQPNHFRIILIRARARIQDPRFPRGSCQGILDPTLTRWIQDSLARPLGNLGSWIQGRARIKMIRT